MKNNYPFLSALFLVCLVAGSAHAQRSFDSKKKTHVPVNTTSLQAKKINRPGPLSQGRSAQHIFQHDRTFVSPTRDPHKILHSIESRPSFIETSRNKTTSATFVRKDFLTGCYEYLQELEPVLGLKNTTTDFIIQRIGQDKNNSTHIRLQQQYKGVPVFGAEVVVHLNSFGEGETFNGRYITPEKDIDVIPSVSKEVAVSNAKASISRGAPIRPLTFLERKYIQHEEPMSTLIVYEDKGLVKSYVLAYRIIYSPSIHKRWEYFIDAHTGAVLNHFNTVCFVDGPKTANANDLNGVSRSINTYQIGANFFMLDASRTMFDASASVLPDEPVGGIMTIDMGNTFGDNSAFSHVSTTTNVWSTANHAKAVSAHFNGGKAYEYYLNNHSRNSINGQGGSIISIINVSDPENGQAMDNAFWNGKAMFYGNGNTEFKPLAGALDVAGHEMTHGVVENTANLEYQGESGAINESMADIFGSMMDPNDWTIGEEVVKLTAFPSGALRSLSDPHNGGTSLSDPGFQPKHMNEKYTGTQDNGGVHINSGIPNHAFFKYAEAITRDKAADVFYKALDDYLTKSSQFIDLRLAVIKAAGDLFGAASNEVAQAGLAFDFVGITSGQGGNYEEELPSNPGSEFLLVYSTDGADPNSLYRTPTSNLNSAVPLTTTAFVSKPSVTDDGSVAVFVAGDKTIHAIVTQPGEDPSEFVLQDEPIWSNVAISKGGNRMAAVTQAWDNTIYVYDFVSQTWGQFELYNPTYSDGINSGGTVYADALEWDYTGEYLVYDAFNQIENSSGNNIEYWDVNFIRAWSVEESNFGDGTISKLFSSLPEGLSIGNPAFAKLSPQVLAFDMVDEINNEYAVLGSNIETGETDIIFVNETLGYPSFNKNDTRVAFTLDDGAGNFETGFVTLNANKISSPNATATGLYQTTIWPVYFAAGSRPIGNEVTGILSEERTVTLSCYPNPFGSEVSMELTREFAVNGKIEITNMVGQRLNNFEANQSDNKLSVKFNNLPPGQYILRVHNGKRAGACRAVKLN